MEIPQPVSCIYKEECSGCTYWHLPYESQIRLKQAELTALFKESQINLSHPIEFLSAGPAQLRDRLDFSLEQGRLGLYHKNSQAIVDLKECVQLSEPLQQWLTEFRNIQWPFDKGSIRLRRGPQGQKGVWLDFANVDIKALLEEKNILHKLLQDSVVEIGQRRKIPMWTGSEYKLRDPQMNVWFQTWMQDQPVNLYCQVASFTQPSLKANKIICQLISSWIKAYPQSRLIEFGSGIGNLTLPAVVEAQSLLACEIDELSLQGLQKTLENLPQNLQSHRAKVKIHRGDFQKKLRQDFSQFDGILANPPRSGLMSFLDSLGELPLQHRPRYFIYMSCFPESLAKDLARLQGFGYQTRKVSIVDQFPQSKHYEVLTLLEREQT